jgi:hypothetical protein
MQARFHGLRSLDGLAAQRASQAREGYWAYGHFIRFNDNLLTIDRMRDELDRRRVSYSFVPVGNTSTDLLRAVRGQRRPVSVMLRTTRPGEHHEVLLLDWTESEVRFVDPDHPDDDVIRGRKWFDACWTGRAILISR